MDELKRYRWAIVALMGLGVLVGLGALALEFQVSSAIQHADAAISGKSGLLPTVTATAADAGEQAASTIADAGARLDASLDKLDTQVAAVGPVVKKLGPALDALKDDETKLGDSIDRVNAPCVPGPCGTFADVGKTLNTVRGTFGKIEIAANHEDRNLGTLDAQEAQLYLDFHGTAIRLNTALETLNLQMANPDLALMMHNGGEFTTTAVAVEKKLAQCTLHPTFPCVFKDVVILGAQATGYVLK